MLLASRARIPRLFACWSASLLSTPTNGAGRDCVRAIASLSPGCTCRPSAADALLDPYFTGLHNPAREPVAEPISKLDYEFEKRKLTVDEVRDLIYREVLEYHPQAKREYTAGEAPANFMFPSAVDNFRRQFAYLESGGQPMASGASGAGRELRRQAQSLPREQMVRPNFTLVGSLTKLRFVTHRRSIGTKEQASLLVQTSPTALSTKMWRMAFRRCRWTNGCE